MYKSSYEINFKLVVFMATFA